jgi:putative flippase GtrA
MKISHIIQWKEFLAYFFIGATTTVMDWSLFWITVVKLGCHYEIGLISAYIPASMFHFFSNKFITFRCKSKSLGSQYSLYIALTLSSLAISMGIIAMLINLLMLDKMIARIATTALMLIPNYLLHKNITFSKRFFATSHT